MLRKLVKLITLLSKPRLFYVYVTKGVVAGVEHEPQLSKLTVSHIVDVGANRGQFALICKECFPNARIDSFEPLSEACADFNRVFKNDRLVHLHQTAIGSKEMDAVIHVSNQDHSSSLLPISEKQVEVFPETKEKETRNIHVSPLNHVLSLSSINSPALLKIDVQGLELEVLEGCGAMLVAFSYIYVECSFVEMYSNQALAHDVINYLSERGFVLSGIFNVYYDRFGNSVQADMMFMKA